MGWRIQHKQPNTKRKTILLRGDQNIVTILSTFRLKKLAIKPENEYIFLNEAITLLQNCMF